MKNDSKERTLSSKVEETLSWPDYLSMIDILGNFIECSTVSFTCVYGIPRGGVIPAVILSHRFNIPLLNDLSNLTNEFVLVIDDIIDSGKTIVDTTFLFRGKCRGIMTASLYKHKDCIISPHFYVKENTGWIIFPYEEDTI